MVSANPVPQSAGEVILSAKQIKKSFNRVEVLHGVDFELHRGEVHGLVGQNGAGKSTLMKIINGVYTRDSGAITINGREANYNTPNGANEHGIAMVFQEFSLIPTMTAVQNLFLSHELRHGPLLDDQAMHAAALRLFADLDVDIDPDQVLSRLSVGERQIVEIAKAVSHNASILIMDEPTASLSGVEIQSLFTLTRRLKRDGISVIFVSHHLNEVLEICDRVTVIRDGNVALSKEIAATGMEDIITAMVGKKFERQQAVKHHPVDRGQPLLEVTNLSSGNDFHDVTFSLYPGEVLGIAGVLGSGRSELLKAFYGILPVDQGEIRMQNRTAHFNHPADAIRSGMILVPEDRRKNGVIAGQPVRANVLQSIWKRLARLGWINEREGDRIVRKYVSDLNIRTTSIEQLVQRLSGGNQQKVVFARSLASEPKILLLDDPTVGVDIETKKEIAAIARKIASLGNGVILVSSEMDELADLSDRVLVLQRGRITQEYDCVQTPVSETMLMHAIQGHEAP
jgi:ribose transport system ATP-binding protein